MSALMRDNRQEELDILAKEIKEHAEKTRIDADLCTAMIQYYLSQNEDKAAVDLIDKMNAVRLTPYQANHLLGMCIQSNSQEAARAILQLIQNQNLHGSLKLTTTLIKYHDMRGDIDSCIEAFSKMKESGVKPDEQLYTTLANTFIANNSQEGLKMILESIKSKHLNTNPMYITAVRVHCELAQFDQALQLTREMNKLKFDLQKPINIMLDKCLRHDDLESAASILASFPNEMNDPSHELKTTYIRYQVAINGPDHIARQLLSDIDKNQYGSESDVADIINTFINQDHLDSAKQCADDFLEKRLPQHSFLYTTMLKVYRNAGLPNRVVSLYQAMNDVGFEQEPYATKLYFYACVDLGEYVEASNSFQTLMNGGDQPTTERCTQLLQAYINARKMKLAMSTYYRLIKEHNFEPDHITFSTLMNGVTDYKNHLLHFKDIYKQSRLHVKVVEQRFQIMLIGKQLEWNKKKGVKEALQLYIEMERFDPDLINLSTFKALFNNPHSKEMIAALKRHINDPSHEMTDTDRQALIICAGYGANYEMALKLFEELPRSYRTFSGIIHACAPNGKAEEAFDFLTKWLLMCGSNDIREMPPNEVFLSVVYACGMSNRLDLAEQAHELCAVYYGTNEEMIMSMVDSYARCGYLKKAQKLLPELKMRLEGGLLSVLMGCRRYDDFIRMKELYKTYREQIINHAACLSIVYGMFWKLGSKRQIAQVAAMLTKSPKGKSNNSSKKGVCSVRFGKNKKNKIKSFQNEARCKKKFLAFVEAVHRDFARRFGYAPDPACTLRPIDSERDQMVHLMFRAEKLAYCAALSSKKMRLSKKVELIKNSRVDPDSHTFLKLASMRFNLKIRLKDSVRFHDFEGGSCSCQDFV
ncbi:hypothetical protein AKO1_004637, partial [Acrasis kona]